MSNLPLKQILEGAIMAAEQPLSIDQMLQLFEGQAPTKAAIRKALEEIAQECQERGYELKSIASGYRFQVKEDYGEWVSRLWKEKPPKYTRALLETLALIAYRQPITRGDIEEVRGVTVSTNIVRTLLEREWVRVVGHRDVPGHPALFATTKTFLDYFNLASLDELPPLSEIKDLAKANEELELEEELIQPRVIDLNELEDDLPPGLADEDLEAVSEQVNTIQENIRSVMDVDDDAEDYDAAEDDAAEGDAADDGAADDVAESAELEDERPK